jgi:hypothetical protein
MPNERLIKALMTKAVSEKEHALMTLELLTDRSVGIGDHTANDFLQDAEIALQRLVDADDKIETLQKYFNKGSLKQSKNDIYK